MTAPPRRWSFSLREALLGLITAAAIAGWYAERRWRLEYAAFVEPIFEAVKRVKAGGSSTFVTGTLDGASFIWCVDTIPPSEEESTPAAPDTEETPDGETVGAPPPPLHLAAPPATVPDAP